MESPRFFNRELSWIEFNARVVAEGARRELPLLERLKFLAIAASNFDEFFMVRVASVKRLVAAGEGGDDPSGMAPSEQLARISARSRELLALQYRCLNEELLPGLEAAGLRIIRPAAYTLAQERYLEAYFKREPFAALSPLRAERGEAFPPVGNLRILVAFLLAPEGAPEGAPGEGLVAVAQLPLGFGRFVPVESEGGGRCMALLEDLVQLHGGELFPGYRVLESAQMRVTKDCDVGVDEERDDDFLEAMSEVIVSRESAAPVALNVSEGAGRLRGIVAGMLGLGEADIYDIPGPLDLKGFFELCSAEGMDEHRNRPWEPVWPASIDPDANIFDEVSRRDHILHLPYESFEPAVRLVEEAARDPAVVAIKMTLYRTSGDSPFVKALAEAAQNGKQVTALVELKARFDEGRNIAWAKQLERSGVIVVYGIARLKVHAKALLIARREPEGIKRYLHLSTGNYNDRTARLYGDIALLSSNEELCYEASLFFNAITGYASIPGLRRLAMAPTGLKHRIISLIDREAERRTADMPGVIIAKMNALADPEVIEALYRASEAGVSVQLNVRGVCMLVPGVPGMSGNISVVSVVDRFLEHARAFYFYNGGAEEIYLSSADWMPRNLEKRVELLFPVLQDDLRRRVLEILKAYFKDTTNSFALGRDGRYVRTGHAPGESGFRAQEVLYEASRASAEVARAGPGGDFAVRRAPAGEGGGR